MDEHDAKRKARVWPRAIAAGRRVSVVQSDLLARLLRGFAGRVQSWAIADVGPGRLMPWLPVAFGFGIVLYFSAEREPAWWAGLVVALTGTVGSMLTRNRPVAFPVLLALTAIAAGFSVATLKTLRIAHPILTSTAFSADVAGFVEVREERERSDRIVVRVNTIDAARLSTKPERIRVSVRKGTAPPVGAYVSFRARLNPPLAPLRPGGYDFARDLYFQRIGAIGYAFGQIRTMEPPEPPHAWLRFGAGLSSMRDAIDQRIRSVVAGDNGSIASALVTGKRDAISTQVNEAMYVSSLAHVLSISGYHMAIVAGIVFFLVRASLALAPSLANRHPIKKWAAVGALAAAAFYLLLSGAEVATQRAFIMTAIVLIGVVADRSALTLRMLGVAVIGVLLLAPEAIVHPSFQMSFAATLALVAGFQYRLPWFARTQDTSLGQRVALWGGREVAALILASLLAGLATMPYAAYHFHRIAPYGVLANLLAMPIVSAWVMPWGILALFAMPFGFDGFFWRLMGEGIGWMTAIALWIASLPGALGRMAAFGVGPLLIGSAGLVILGLLRSPLRWFGAGLIAIASLWAINAPRPHVLISGDGQVVAVRTADGRLAVMKGGRDMFSVRDWLAADGDARAPRDASLDEGSRCDRTGCIATLPDGRLVALSLTAEAFEEDCRRAMLVVTPRVAPPGCAALAIDRPRLQATGATTLHVNGPAFDITPTRPPGYDRPWARTAVPSPAAQPHPARRSGPRDATPRLEDLEPGD